MVTAGQILGISRTSAYRLARTGTFPIPVVKAGPQYRVSVAAQLAAVLPLYPPPAHTAAQQHPR